jgi:uncharacterized protein
MIASVVTLAGSAAVALAAAAATPPSPTRWVTDERGFLSPTARAALDDRLERYERATGHQVVVWIGGSLDGAPLEEWAVRTFAAWRVGRAKLDDGVAMFVLADDRAIDIEVGYGLEGQVPDAVAARIIGDVMAPRLRAGDRDGAVTAGVDALLAAIEGRPWDGAAGPGEPPSRPGPSTTELVFGILAALVFLFLFITNPRFALLLLWTIVSGGRGRGVGGAGGFTGAGGRSGGGGARGHW